VDIKTLYNWLKNPQKYRKNLINLSRYYYTKDGLITDVYDMFKTLPILNYSVFWENMQMKKFKVYKQSVDKFLKDIKIKKLVRDTIFSVIQDGVCVWYNRNGKYIQFLSEDEVRVIKIINGKWQVDFDMQYFNTQKSLYNYTLNDVTALIEAAPDEVNIQAYNNYKKDPTKYRFVPLDINKTQVFKLRGERQVPASLPYCVGALSSIIHRDLLERSEKAVADRIINQVVLQTVDNMTKDGKPPTKDQIARYHENLKQILQKKYNDASTENSSVAPLTIPAFVNIKELEIKMNVFAKEVWERIDRSIYMKLGYSPSLNFGGGDGQSFGSGTINVEKIYAILFCLIEDIEDGVNDYLNQIVPTSNFNPRIWISRQTILDRKTSFDQAKSLYTDGRGSWKYFIESAGYNWEHYLSQCQYENDVLKLDEILPVHPTSATRSADDNVGNPGKDMKDKKDSSIKSDGNKGNAVPNTK